jgi:hypothetical protein
LITAGTSVAGGATSGLVSKVVSNKMEDKNTFDGVGT